MLMRSIVPLYPPTTIYSAESHLTGCLCQMAQRNFGGQTSGQQVGCQFFPQLSNSTYLRLNSGNLIRVRGRLFGHVAGEQQLLNGEKVTNNGLLLLKRRYTHLEFKQITLIQFGISRSISYCIKVDFVSSEPKR